jgi:hypothetical protein
MSITRFGYRLFAVVFVPVALAACFETTGSQQYFVPEASRTAAAGKAPEPVRAKLESTCIDESGVIFRTDEKITKQCGCYASAMMKSLTKDDLEFFATYGVVPTLSGVRPDEVKKQCGMTVLTYHGPRGKLAPAETY